MKKIVCIVMFLCTVLSPFVLSGYDVFAEENDMSISAKAYVLMDAASGDVLLESDMNERMSMASTTKIMTALLALEYHDIDKEFTVAPESVHVEGSSMGLLEGDVVTLRALSYGMLLKSGNDAANATAYALAGGIDSFAGIMNAKAKELGMDSTNFETPSGLDSENHYSTAYDMAILARAALSNEIFAGICSTQRAEVSYGNPPYNRWMKNHNRLLSEYEGCIGVKTGFTKKSGRCLVSAAERDGARLICVTLSAPDDWNDHKKLFDYGFERYTKVDIDPEIDLIKLPVTGGLSKTVGFYTDKEMESVLVANDEVDSIRKVVNLPKFLFAPVESDENIGDVNFYINDNLVASYPLYVKNRVESLPKKSFLDWFKAKF